MNLLRATSPYQSFRDITNTPEGSETRCEKRFGAFEMAPGLQVSTVSFGGSSQLPVPLRCRGREWATTAGSSLATLSMGQSCGQSQSSATRLSLGFPGLSRGAATKPPGCQGCGGGDVPHATLDAFF